MFKVAIIIPSYNRIELLVRAIDSVLAQSYRASQIIVVDDGSTDDTGTVITSQYPQVDYRYQPHRGVSSARNHGIWHSHCDWICLLDSDDSWAAGKLKAQVNALAAAPDYLLCHTNETWYHNGQHRNQQKQHQKKGGAIFQHCLPRCVISPSSVMIKKTVFAVVGGFDETLPAAEDYELWLRICCRYPLLFIDQPLVNKYGGHADQLSRQYWGLDRFRIIALAKTIETQPLNAADRCAAIAMLLNKINIFLNGAKKHGDNEYCAPFRALKRRYQHGDRAA